MARARTVRGSEALSPPDAHFVVGDLAFRPIVDADVPTLAEWLRDPEVGGWWEGTSVVYDDGYVRAEMLHDDEHVTQAIVELDGRPVGFQQWYDVSRDEDAQRAFALSPADRAYGIDQLLGVSALHGRGIGTRQVDAVSGWLLGPEGPGAALVVTDPVVENARAVRCYQKAGFSIIRRLRGHERIDGEPRDCWLMERRRGSGIK